LSTVAHAPSRGQNAFHRISGRHGESARGSALLSVTLLMFLFSAIAVAAAVVIRVEVIVAERFRQSEEARYAAQAALEVAVAELRPLSSWSTVVNGADNSRFTQGGFLGAKNVPGGGVVNVCCDVDSVFDRFTTTSRASPVPVRRALVWRPFIWTTFNALVPRDPPSRLFVIVFVADDEEDVVTEGEGDTNGVLLLRAEAIDPSGLHRTVEALIARPAVGQPQKDAETGMAIEEPQTAMSQVAILTWREVR
jgi:hypothetical protein